MISHLFNLWHKRSIYWIYIFDPEHMIASAMMYTHRTDNSSMINLSSVLPKLWFNSNSLSFFPIKYNHPKFLSFLSKSPTTHFSSTSLCRIWHRSTCRHWQCQMMDVSTSVLTSCLCGWGTWPEWWQKWWSWSTRIADLIWGIFSKNSKRSGYDYIVKITGREQYIELNYIIDDTHISWINKLYIHDDSIPGTLHSFRTHSSMSTNVDTLISSPFPRNIQNPRLVPRPHDSRYLDRCLIHHPRKNPRRHQTWYDIT